MILQLETLPYQQLAIDAVLGLFEGQPRNSFASSFLHTAQINRCDLTPDELNDNAKRITGNGLDPFKYGHLDTAATLKTRRDFCIKMETGTSKTLGKANYRIDHMKPDSNPAADFARDANRNVEVVCFLKFPDKYRIPIPGGCHYKPNWDVVYQRKKLSGEVEDTYYFVVETKSTNVLTDTKQLNEDEKFKMGKQACQKCY